MNVLMVSVCTLVYVEYILLQYSQLPCTKLDSLQKSLCGVEIHKPYKWQPTHVDIIKENILKNKIWNGCYYQLTRLNILTLHLYLWMNLDIFAIIQVCHNLGYQFWLNSPNPCTTSIWKHYKINRNLFNTAPLLTQPCGIWGCLQTRDASELLACTQLR